MTQETTRKGTGKTEKPGSKREYKAESCAISAQIKLRGQAARVKITLQSRELYGKHRQKTERQSWRQRDKYAIEAEN
ncbi:hypothetical protein HA44_18070 [Mixta gaviniae]|nr:hypothetical protein HA44_18070 [Mixta gaviniae]